MQPSGCMTRRVEGKMAYRAQRLTWTLRPPVSKKIDAAATSGLQLHLIHPSCVPQNASQMFYGPLSGGLVLLHHQRPQTAAMWSILAPALTPKRTHQQSLDLRLPLRILVVVIEGPFPPESSLVGKGLTSRLDQGFAMRIYSAR